MADYRDHRFRVVYSDGMATDYTIFAASANVAFREAVQTITRHEREAGLTRRRWISSVTDVTSLAHLGITAEEATQNAVDYNARKAST